jgi:hypothetical protein
MTAISFDVDTSPLFHSDTEDTLVIQMGDLSQLGLKRNMLPDRLHMPAVTKATLSFPGLSGNKIWKNFLQGELTEGKTIIMEVDSSALQNALLGNSLNAHHANIAALQASLNPETKITLDAILGHERMKAAMKDITDRYPSALAQFAGYLSAQAADNERLANYLIASEIVDVEKRTIVQEGGITVSSDDVRGITYGQLQIASSLLPEMDESLKSSFAAIEFTKLRESSPDQAFVFEHSAVRNAFLSTKRELLTRSYVAPAGIDEWLSANSHGDYVTASFKLKSGEDVFNLHAKEDAKAMIGEFAFYMLSLKQIVVNSMDRAKEFAASRTLVLRHGLFVDSKEVSPFTITDELRYNIDDLRAFVDFYHRNEKYYIGMYCSVISFLKSGHHATAANLDNTLQKMLSAVNIPTSLEGARAMIPCMVYNGPHVASMRLLYAFLLKRNTDEKITNSISYRLSPNPPLSAAYCNLEIFIEALAAAGFFEALGRNAELASFRANMEEIKATMYFCSPYAHYLYGRDIPDPQHLKSEVAKLAAYASALGTALPNSSLVLSPSLKKLAEENARNSISATLYVSSFAAAFTHWCRGTIEQSLKKKLGRRPTQQLLE